MDLFEESREMGRIAKPARVARLFDKPSRGEHEVEGVVHPEPEQILIGADLAVFAEQATEIRRRHAEPCRGGFDAEMVAKVVTKGLATS